MPDSRISVDTSRVRRVFAAFPEAATRRLNRLLLAGAIDTQAEMRREVNVGYSGDTRRSIRYVANPAELSVTIQPNVPHAEALEKGSRPHWTSARPGSSLAKWARFKGLNPYAVQRSIASKGTKAHPFVRPTYNTMRPRVQRLVVAGISRFIQEVDNGGI